MQLKIGKNLTTARLNLTFNGFYNKKEYYDWSLSE